ncbi:MAG: PhzF family phenazine biosynthesis protein [Thermoplasmatota archaeon]
MRVEAERAMKDGRETGRVGNTQSHARRRCEGAPREVRGPPVAALVEGAIHGTAFSGPGLLGNPSALFLCDSFPAVERMLAAAAALAYSEIAFARPLERGGAEGSRYELRFFSPKVELPQCGHATMVAAGALFGMVPDQRIQFETAAGPMGATRHRRGVELNFPEDRGEPFPPPRPLLVAMGIADSILVLHSKRTGKLLLELPTEDAVRALAPDFRAMKAAAAMEVKGVIVTARSDGETDFVSRYFNPWVGVDEDPVTGNAHCVLAPFWGERLGKRVMRGIQASKRGGLVEVELLGDGRVALRGQVTLGRPS